MNHNIESVEFRNVRAKKTASAKTFNTTNSMIPDWHVLEKYPRQKYNQSAGSFTGPNGQLIERHPRLLTWFAKQMR